MNENHITGSEMRQYTSNGSSEDLLLVSRPIFHRQTYDCRGRGKSTFRTLMC